MPILETINLGKIYGKKGNICTCTKECKFKNK